jgi:hypothetical protein
MTVVIMASKDPKCEQIPKVTLIIMVGDAGGSL